MAQEDWAIVVGITRYSDPVEFPPLDGPENDAKSFYSWLTDAAGGGVPGRQVKLIVSSQYPPRAATATAKKDPSEVAVEKAFQAYDTLSRRNMAAGRGQRVGRRLYLYLAGHGFEIPWGSDRYAVLLTANATKDQVTHHLSGRLWADKYINPGLFDEVILLMDCCRLDLPLVPLQNPGVPPPIPGANPRYFYAFGAQPRLNAYEKRFGAKVGGVFTRTLLRGLRGAASEPNGNITADSLHNHMVNNMRNLLTQEEQDDPTISKWPEVTSSDPPGRFLIGSAPPMKYKVGFRGRAGDEGKVLSVSDPTTENVIFRDLVKAGGPVETILLRGNYKWDIGDGERSGLVTVSDSEEVIHVFEL